MGGITDDQIEQLIEQLCRDLGPEDYEEFADRLYAVDRIVGTYERLHAASADHASPSLGQWPELVRRDMRTLAEHGVSTVEDAAALWHRLHDQD